MRSPSDDELYEAEELSPALALSTLSVSSPLKENVSSASMSALPGLCQDSIPLLRVILYIVLRISGSPASPRLADC